MADSDYKQETVSPLPDTPVVGEDGLWDTDRMMSSLDYDSTQSRYSRREHITQPHYTMPELNFSLATTDLYQNPNPNPIPNDTNPNLMLNSSPTNPNIRVNSIPPNPDYINSNLMLNAPLTNPDPTNPNLILNTSPSNPIPVENTILPRPNYTNPNQVLNTSINPDYISPNLVMNSPTHPNEMLKSPTNLDYANPNVMLNSTPSTTPRPNRTLPQPSYINRRNSWTSCDTSWATPPDTLQVTHVNQTYDLLHSVPANNISSPTSKEWLQNHGIEALKLTFKDFVDKGRLVGPQADSSTGEASHYVAFNPQDIVSFEQKLSLAMTSYKQRIDWLLQGSRKVFGVSSVRSVAVAVDCSSTNTSYGRMDTLKNFLLELIDEQLCKKSFLYFTSFGTETHPLWPTCQQVNPKTLSNARLWVQQLKQQQNGCNVMQVLKDIAQLVRLDSVILILGSVPDQKPDILSQFTEQMFAGKETTVDGVSYDCSNYLTNLCLRKICEATRGRFHCYSSCCEDLIYSGSDISLLVQEIQKVKDIFKKIEASKEGMMGKAVVNIQDEVVSELQKLPQSLLLPQPPGHTSPLNIAPSNHPRLSSAQWLKLHGLKAKKLNLYHFLQPNAFNYQKHFVPVINKTVQSQVHEKAMVQFQWYDGSVKNVHVDMAQIFDYQKQLGAAVSLYEQRIEWLSTGSRRMFGTISGQRVVILLDLSVSTIKHLVHIQHAMRLLLEQQLHDKQCFNIISFGQTPQKWSETMKKPTEENLQSAWQWILESKCKGSRNFLAAFRMVLENNTKKSNRIDPDAVYVFTSGALDQPEAICVPYVQEICIGRGIELHTCLFHLKHLEDTTEPSRICGTTHSDTVESLKNLAHCTIDGRFHWFQENGTIQSDDILCIMREIDKALIFSNKCSHLTQAVKKKYRNETKKHQSPVLPICYTPPIKNRPVSRQPSSLKRQLHGVTSSGKLSAGARLLSSMRPVSSDQPKTKSKQSVYAESIYKRNCKLKLSDSKKLFHIDPLVGIEDSVSSKQWMRKYSLSNLKLNLNKLLSIQSCKHNETNVKVLKRNVTAKYCEIFPTVNVNGTLKHLHLKPQELKEYIKRLEYVLKFYLRRMQWLLSGSRKIFGTVIHKDSTFLIDVSGSMNPHLDQLKRELTNLVWEQLYKNQTSFNLICFSNVCKSWQSCTQAATKENCQSAIAWCSKLQAAGGTCTLEALQRAFSDKKTKAIYLLTDGKPDASRSLIFRKLKRMNKNRKIPVNTISFNCSDCDADDFLKELATHTAGRYHNSEANFNINLFIHKLLTNGFHNKQYPEMPHFESDDLNRLSKEVELARSYLSQCGAYRNIYSEFQNSKVKSTATSDSVKEKKKPDSESNPFAPILNLVSKATLNPPYKVNRVLSDPHFSISTSISKVVLNAGTFLSLSKSNSTTDKIATNIATPSKAISD